MKIVTSAALAVALGAAALLPPTPARAMCGPVTRPDQVVVVDGDQRVFIYHRGGMEDLILQASVKGKGADFGMILPLPAVPDIRKVERAFFDDLFAMTRVRQVEWEDGARKMAAAPEGLGGGDPALERVEVVKKDVVGPFETVVLKAKKIEVLMDWLKDNGYQTPAENVELMRSYLDKGWFFVAVKVTPEARDQVFDGRTQPMGFRFPTQEIILPTKMASMVPDGMNFTIYVLTNSRISLPGFQQQQTVSLARPVTPAELRTRPNLAAVLDRDVLLSEDGAVEKLVEAAKTADPKMAEEFLSNKYRGLYINKFNGFFPKAKLAEGDVVFKREGLLTPESVGNLLEALAKPPAESAVARQLLEAGGADQLAAVERGLAHADYRIRRAAAEILGVIGDRRSAKPLVAALKTETDDFVKSGINRALQALSGQGIKSHQVDKWEEWLATQK